jgi:hypothetical protein
LYCFRMTGESPRRQRDGGLKGVHAHQRRRRKEQCLEEYKKVAESHRVGSFLLLFLLL